jgi:cytoskeletal protein RodZ
MINMIKKFLIFIMLVVFSAVLLVFVWNQYRHFYQVDSMTFTVGKKWGGLLLCYSI